jgi:hypothetical protein
MIKKRIYKTKEWCRIIVDKGELRWKENYILDGWKSYFQKLLIGRTQKEKEQKYGEEEDLEMKEDGEISVLDADIAMEKI